MKFFLQLSITIIFMSGKLVTAQSTDSLLMDMVPAASLNQSKLNNILSKFDLSAYGVINYHNYDWETLPDKRNDIDFERAVISTSYKINKRYRLNTELEFEHAGTGVTVEFDPLEEFGEFEYEVEKGGEIYLEQFNIEYKLNNNINLSGGKIRVPFGIIAYRDEPTEYSTNNLNEAEAAMIPTTWTEYGVSIFGNIKNWHYNVSIVNALDGSAFNSANFIKRGNQKRFETVNANDFAIAGRLDYKFGEEKFIGLSGYYGNSKNNRPKPDLDVDAYVGMYDFHCVMEVEPIEFSASVIYGTLQNADKVSFSNRNLSNNLNVKRTPVGSSALGYSFDVGLEIYDLLPMLGMQHPNGELIIFGRYDFYDTMHSVTGDIYDNPRWERKTTTVGINYHPISQLVFKAQYAMRKISIPQKNSENTFSLGAGFYIK
ncbi:MAG TPA: porin [Bacteroidia bacterium]|nr:porin [Bacteroidia bacterium]HNU32818.1 porin [Bacteroidia bacterium]